MMYPPKQQHALTCSHTHTHSHSRSAEMKTKINLKINTSVKSGKTLFRARTHTYTRKLLAVLFCSHWCVLIYTHKLEEKTQTTQNRTYNIPIYNNFFFFCVFCLIWAAATLAAVAVTAAAINAKSFHVDVFDLLFLFRAFFTFFSRHIRSLRNWNSIIRK